MDQSANSAIRKGEKERMYFNGDELSERKKLILHAIIDAHIGNGEPVGSKYLTTDARIRYSPATVRNEMSELEEMGYLEQPHTSAGRIPSERGYRFYVNSLMERYKMTGEELAKLNEAVRQKESELDSILESASKLMSMFTNYTSLSVKPKPKSSVILRFNFMQVSDRTMLLIMLTDRQTVKTRSVNLPFDITPSMSEHFTEVFNTCLAGVPMERVTLPLILDMESRLKGCEMIVNPIIKCIYEVISEIDNGELKFENINKMLQYPEYSDIERLRGLLSMFENKEDILNIVSNSQKDVINILIGKENTVDIMNNSTLIFKTITSGDRVLGAIGVIGPTRMAYSKVITTVDTLSKAIKDKAEEMLGPPGLPEKKD